MAFAITKSCCSDASCVSVCPVGCIHPAPGEPGFGTSEILHIDPASCIDCGACADACPVQAIFPVDKLSSNDRVYAQINAAFRPPEESGETTTSGAEATYPHIPQLPDGLRVCVVGSGPAGMYTVKELLARTNAEITVIDALPTPGGLVRSGVAADHPETKGIQRTFDLALRHPRVRFLGGVHVGSDITLPSLRAAFDAVFLATGARRPRLLGVPGEAAKGVHSALDVVRWAGGEPGADGSPFDGTPAGAPPRAVIVGTGNVALDLVRLFTLPIERLNRTELADRALTVLDKRPVLDVVVLGRGGSQEAAYTEAEYRALAEVPGLEIRVIEAGSAVAEVPWDVPTHARVTFVFGSVVEGFQDNDGLLTISVHRPEAGERTSWNTRIAITSIGHEAEHIDGLPPTGSTYVGPPDTAAAAGAIHAAGRVNGASGLYVVGWAKRGAVGGIGANRPCAAESVDSFLDDASALQRATTSPRQLRRALRAAGVRLVDKRGSTRIDAYEAGAGAVTGRPRIKLTELEELHRAARRRLTLRR